MSGADAPPTLFGLTADQLEDLRGYVEAVQAVEALLRLHREVGEEREAGSPASVDSASARELGAEVLAVLDDVEHRREDALASAGSRAAHDVLVGLVIKAGRVPMLVGGRSSRQLAVALDPGRPFALFSALAEAARSEPWGDQEDALVVVAAAMKHHELRGSVVYFDRAAFEPPP